MTTGGVVVENFKLPRMTVWFILDHSDKIGRYYHQKVKLGIRDSTEISMLEIESLIFSGVFLSSMLQRRLPATVKHILNCTFISNVVCISTPTAEAQVRNLVQSMWDLYGTGRQWDKFL
jgi:hypothetical protein